MNLHDGIARWHCGFPFWGANCLPARVASASYVFNEVFDLKPTSWLRI
jgi:hypothetical protein